MTPAEELKWLIRRYPGHLYYLVMNEKHKMANMLYSKGIPAIIEYLKLDKSKLEKNSTRRYSQVTNLLYSYVTKQAERICTSPQAAYDWLVRKYGSGKEVLVMMRLMTSGRSYYDAKRAKASSVKGRGTGPAVSETVMARRATGVLSTGSRKNRRRSRN